MIFGAVLTPASHRKPSSPQITHLLGKRQLFHNDADHLSGGLESRDVKAPQSGCVAALGGGGDVSLSIVETPEGEKNGAGPGFLLRKIGRRGRVPRKNFPRKAE